MDSVPPLTPPTPTKRKPTRKNTRLYLIIFLSVVFTGSLCALISIGFNIGRNHPKPVPSAKQETVTEVASKQTQPTVVPTLDRQAPSAQVSPDLQKKFDELLIRLEKLEAYASAAEADRRSNEKVIIDRICLIEASVSTVSDDTSNQVSKKVSEFEAGLESRVNSLVNAVVAKNPVHQNCSNSSTAPVATVNTSAVNNGTPPNGTQVSKKCATVTNAERMIASRIWDPENLQINEASRRYSPISILTKYVYWPRNSGIEIRGWYKKSAVVNGKESVVLEEPLTSDNLKNIEVVCFVAKDRPVQLLVRR